MSKVKYLENPNFGIVKDSEGRTSLDGGETYFIYDELSEDEKRECIEDCLAFFACDFSTELEARESVQAETIEEIEERIDYLLR